VKEEDTIEWMSLSRYCKTNSSLAYLAIHLAMVFTVIFIKIVGVIPQQCSSSLSIADIFVEALKTVSKDT
jgi:hypothetical protein